MTERLTHQSMMQLAASSVDKVDLLGRRGTTLVSCEDLELEAIACVIALSCIPPAAAEGLPAGGLPKFKSIRSKR